MAPAKKLVGFKHQTWGDSRGHHGGKKWYVYIYIGNADLVGGSDVLEMFPLLR